MTAIRKIYNTIRSSKILLYSSLSLLGVITIMAYLFTLQYKEIQAEKRYEELRKTDPDAYLSKVKDLHGFDAFVENYQKLRAYEEPRKKVPPFVLGRWALRSEPKSVKATYIPNTCQRNLIIEDGKIRKSGKKNDSYEVRYTMADGRIRAQTGEGDTITIAPVGYGIHLHHLKIDLPDKNHPVYGYLCR